MALWVSLHQDVIGTKTNEGGKTHDSVYIKHITAWNTMHLKENTSGALSLPLNRPTPTPRVLVGIWSRLKPGDGYLKSYRTLGVS